MMTRPDRARMALVAACLLGVSAANSLAKLEARQESLRGVQAMIVDVNISKGAIESGLTEEEQRKAIEKQLGQATIKVMPKQFWGNVPGRCRLKATADVYKPSGLEMLMYSVRLCFVQTVTLERSPQTTVDATTWELTWLAHCPKNRLGERVSECLEAMVDSFIKDYRASNPQPGEEPAGAVGSNTGTPANAPFASNGNPETTEQGYVASRSSSVFHKPDCRWAQNISSTNLISYKSKDEAIRDGKRPCKSCNP